MENIKRIFVEKKNEFDIEAKKLLTDININLEIDNLLNVRVLNRYDLSDIDNVEMDKVVNMILSEPQVDNVFYEIIKIDESETEIAVEYLPGQYDQRADSAAQCIQILLLKEKPLVSTAKIFILKGSLTDIEKNKIKKYLINSVDSREAELIKPLSLNKDYINPPDVEILNGFIDKNMIALEDFIQENGLAMSKEDIKFCQNYFKETEKRAPSITEIKMLDTYWSDHCRHTTFETIIDDVRFEDSLFIKPIKDAYQAYLDSKDYVYEGQERETTLMNLAIISMKEMRKRGLLDDLEISSEINACSIERDVIIDGKKEKWLIMFKNETHNHPTEIEPFGGAATCLGGAIRDPLSGRAYVYQAMRVTGSADPRVKVNNTIEGKLPQKKITTEAALGYSSYGNQIGLATGLVSEIYDEGYMAKRMEVGAVIGAAPKENVRREEPEPGDIIVLVGGKTGRDGIGGATGSSKEHTVESIIKAGAEVQKGNAPEERKLQRLFRDKKVTSLIKKSNDFGAGGVSVAIGELADGLIIDLDMIHKKYDGLDGTELSLSESQERMAVVLKKEDVDKFIEYSASENLIAVKIAEVTDSNRLIMKWRGKNIVDISRDFLNTNGVKQTNGVFVSAPKEENNYFNAYKEKNDKNIKKRWLEYSDSLFSGSQRGLIEQFDSSIGAATVFMPYGGKYQSTPMEAMVAKIPLLSGYTETCTLMSHGFNPKISKWSSFHGALYSVIEAIAKIVALGGNYSSIRTSLQEYFEKLGKDKEKWGKPFAALLGANYALTKLKIAAIGGKDSMSGSFKNLNVPPTLITFAVNTASINEVISPEFKEIGNTLILYKVQRDKYELPDFEQLKAGWDEITKGIKTGKIISAHTITNGGISEALSKMSFGNRIGVKLEDIDSSTLFSPDYGSVLFEVASGDISSANAKNCAQFFPPDPQSPRPTGLPAGHATEKCTSRLYIDELIAKDNGFQIIGKTIKEPVFIINDTKITIDEIQNYWEKPLESVFPTKIEASSQIVSSSLFTQRKEKTSKEKYAKPRILIPVFPGTNCEYDTQSAFNKVGGMAETFVFRNQNSSDIQNSLDSLKKMIDNSQIIAIPGGFSAGDEPDGSGKFIAAVFQNPYIKEAVMNLLNKRDGLMIGICNGFQALIKLGLVPYGKIIEPEKNAPTLTINEIGRHISMVARTKVVSVLSPWFKEVSAGDVFSIPVSHGEGRFVADTKLIENLHKNGQIASQYVDIEGNPSMDIKYNPNGSFNAIEAITSPDGRVLGKMGHSERTGTDILRNIHGNKDQKIFNSGVKYFS